MQNSISKFKWYRVVDKSPINGTIVIIYDKYDLYHIVMYTDNTYRSIDLGIEYSKRDIVAWGYVPHCPDRWRFKS